MTPTPRTRLLVETLEDRVTPSVTVFYDGSNLRMTGTTASPTFALTETANNTVMTPLGTYSVTGNLSVTLTEVIPANSLTITYTLGAFHANGAVSLSGTAIGPASTTTVTVVGTTATVGGPLTVTVLNPNADAVNVNGLTVGGIQVTDTLGKGTVNIGNTANVTDNGNLFVANANTVNLGVGGGATTATIQGLASVSTRAVTGVTNAFTFNTLSSIQGSLIFTGAGNNNVTLGGSVLGALVAQLGNGANTLTFAATSAILGNVTVVGGNGGNTVTATAGSLFVGSTNTIILGNSPNTVDFNGTALGGVSYLGGNGGDSFTFDTLASAGSLFLIFGNGNDTFTLNTDSVNSIFANGGFGTNTFVPGPGVVIMPRFTLINFGI